MSLTRFQTVGSLLVRQVVELDGQICIWQEGMCRVPRFPLAVQRSRQDDIACPQAGLALSKSKQGPACPEFYVVWVRANREHRQRFASSSGQEQWQHGRINLVAA